MSARNPYWRRRQQRLRARWRQIGSCPQCGEPTTRFVYCLSHRQQRASVALRSYHKQKAA